ncbi:lactate utilization protein C [Bacillus shivajii]|uniref:LutC/YkgG family protein n=1 Tax=Bacillus shivajii TaxID=1983719 RepID=UPI001CFB8827|nr:lactate utilization protein C [Bacillus shivajii]UCZ54372.1 lactate utilization protein C [Bacillus shivajii]
MPTGTIQGKDRFLKNIADKLGRKQKTEKVELPKWSKRPQDEVFKSHTKDELLNEFVKHCDKIHTKVKVTTKSQLAKQLHEAVEELGGQSIVHWEDDRFEQFGLLDALNIEKEKGVDVHKWEPDLRKENIKIAERTNIGITFSDMTLAESGTVVLLSDEGKGRSVSLLPQTYLAIIPKSTLVPRMTQANEQIHEIAKQQGKIPSCINFISGPSNSADIELRLVVGVHGPVKAYYIVIDDA